MRSPRALDTASAESCRTERRFSGSIGGMGRQSRGTRTGPTAKLPAGHIDTRLLRFSGDEHVPSPADRLDRPRPVGVFLDLAAQSRDADVDRAVEGLPLAVAG